MAESPVTVLTETEFLGEQIEGPLTNTRLVGELNMDLDQRTSTLIESKSNMQKNITIIGIIIGVLMIAWGTYYISVNNSVIIPIHNNSGISDNNANLSEELINLDKASKLQITPQTNQNITPDAPPEKQAVENNANTNSSNILSDFVNNLDTCTNTKFNRSMTADFLGNNATTNVDYEITSNNGKCTLNLTVNEIKLSLGEELSKSVGQTNTQFLDTDGSELDIEQFYKNINKTYNPLIGKSGYCDIASNKQELIEFFTEEKGDFMSYSDIAFLVFGSDLNCKGPVFEESEKIGKSLSSFSFPE